MTTTFKSPSPQRRQGVPARGFSLVELSIGLMILGALMAGGVYLLDMTSKRSATDKLNPTRMAEHALIAYAHAKRELPPPKDPEPSPVPGYRQGKVPWDVLGLPDGGAVRYVVDEAMLSPTVANTYRPNLRGEPLHAGPSGLLGGPGRGVARADFCQRLMTLQRSAKPLASGLSAVFLTADLNDVSYQNAQARGYGELAAQFGCVELLSELHGKVAAIYAIEDHQKLLNYIQLPIDVLSVTADTERLAFDATNGVFFANKALLLSTAAPTAGSQGLTSWISGAPTAAATTGAAAAAGASLVPGIAAAAAKFAPDVVFLAESSLALASTAEQISNVDGEVTAAQAAFVKHFSTY